MHDFEMAVPQINRGRLGLVLKEPVHPILKLEFMAKIHFSDTLVAKNLLRISFSDD